MRQLKDQRVLPQSLLEALPGAVALVDDHGVFDAVNHQLSLLTGFSCADLVGQGITMILPDLDQEDLLFTCQFDVGTKHSPPAPRERDLAVSCRDGASKLLTCSFSQFQLENRTWTIVTISNNTTQRALEMALESAEHHSAQIEATAVAAIARSEQRFRLAFEWNMAPMVFSNQGGGFLEVNDSYCKMTGRTREELIGRDSKHFTYPEDIGISEEVTRRINSGGADQVRYNKRFIHKNGRIVVAEVSVCSARDQAGQAIYFISSVRDITEERALSNQLSYQALHDPLTGLANRALFDDRLEHAKARVLRQGDLGAVLLLDLDDFKGVNDAYGHLVGDQLLVMIAHRFEKVTRSSDTICRFGGDEFLYLAEGLPSGAEAEKIAERLLGALSDPFEIDDLSIDQHASVGIVVWNSTSAHTDNVELVQNADASMYEAKRRGHGHLVVFTPDIRHEAVSRFALVQELRQALTLGQLDMHYQPIIDLATTDVVGFEALMRWHHPVRGWVPPDVFIPLAEQSDLILDLGTFAMHEAVTAASSWEPQGSRAIAPYVTVNLSARQFHDPNLVTMIESEIEQAGLAPERLVLEVTETVALDNIAETMVVMDHLNRMGVGVALDDFGTGYSSLSYLAALNPRIIKIDQSFVRPHHDLGRSNTLLEAIVTLGSKLDMVVLAEGIETPEQLERLNNLHCDLGQGFLWSPAVPNNEAMTMLEEASDS
jgi:diguanylate cyclase (GGDEF)-like protein/PAS domain S-box-containing protein